MFYNRMVGTDGDPTKLRLRTYLYRVEARQGDIYELRSIKYPDSTLSLSQRATLGHRGRTLAHPGCLALFCSVQSTLLHQSKVRPRTHIPLSASHNNTHTQHTAYTATKWLLRSNSLFRQTPPVPLSRATRVNYRPMIRLSHHCLVYICMIPPGDPPSPADLCRLVPLDGHAGSSLGCPHRVDGRLALYPILGFSLFSFLLALRREANIFSFLFLILC